MASRSRRSQWLRIWLVPMSCGLAAGAAGLAVNSILGYSGRQGVDLVIGGVAVITAGLNMWSAWVTVTRISETGRYPG